MEKHSCKTYFAVYLSIDKEKNCELLRERLDCAPEEIGIFNKDEIEKFITDTFGVIPVWDRHCFIIGYNERYDVDVNVMLRVTLKGLLGKEAELRALQDKFSVATVLEIVPYIVADSDEPTQILAVDRDIVEFLYKSGAELDIDYYII